MSHVIVRHLPGTRGPLTGSLGIGELPLREINVNSYVEISNLAVVIEVRHAFTGYLQNGVYYSPRTTSVTNMKDGEGVTDCQCTRMSANLRGLRILL